MGLERARVAEIYIESTRRIGSGYLLTDSHLLTAHHVVAQNGQDEVAVPQGKARLLGQHAWFPVSVVWSDPHLDVALLMAIESIPDLSVMPPPPVLGCVNDALAYPCEAIGFPDAQAHDRLHDTEYLRGEVRPHTGLKREVIQVDLSGHTPAADEWRGLSGAALFSSDFLIGVIIEAKRAYSGGRLIVQPIVKVRAQLVEHGLHLPDPLPLVPSQPATPDLLREYVASAVGTATPAPPPPRVKFIERPRELAELRRAILEGTSGTGAFATGLRGMPGVGKTYLAARLCEDPEILRRFPDGCIWVTVGNDLGNLTRQMLTISRALGDRPEYYSTTEDGANRLHMKLADKAILIVLDDVWKAAHVRPFLTSVPRCHVLFTTRNAEIALVLQASEMHLNLLPLDSAIALLGAWAGRSEPEFPKIATRLGFLPLALTIAGVRMREGMSGQQWLDQFDHRVSRIRVGYSSQERDESLQVCFDLSVNLLCEPDRRLYYALGIFPQDELVMDAEVIRLWQALNPALDSPEAAELLTYLRRTELVDGSERRAVRLHDLLHDYAREHLGDSRKSAHEALLRSYNPDGRPWSTVTYDDCPLSRIVYHIHEAYGITAVLQLLRETNPEGRNGWYLACEEAGQTIEYMQELERTRADLEASDATDIASGRLATSLGDGLRLALCQSSVRSLRADLPVEIVTALVDLGVWHPDRALQYTQRIDDTQERFDILRMLLSKTRDADISAAIVREAQKALLDLESDARLTAVRPMLTSPRDVLAEALAQNGLMDKALELAAQSPKDYIQRDTIRKIIPLVRQPKDVDFLFQLIEPLRPYYRVELRSLLAEKVPDRCVEIAEQVRDDYGSDPYMDSFWVYKIIPLVKSLPGSNRQSLIDWVIGEALAVDAERVVEALEPLTEYLSADQARRVIADYKQRELLQKLPDRQIEAILPLSRRLSYEEYQSEWNYCLGLVRQEEKEEVWFDENSRIEAFAALAAEVTTVNHDIYDELLKRLRQVAWDDFTRSSVLKAVCKAVPTALLDRFVAEIPHISESEYALSTWKVYLATRPSPELVAAARTAAKCYERGDRFQLLFAIAKTLPDNERRVEFERLLAEAEADDYLIDEELVILDHLRELADINVPGRRLLARLASCPSRWRRVPEWFIRLAQIASESLRSQIIDALFEADDLVRRRNTLAAMATMLTPQELQRVLTLGGRINDEFQRNTTLRSFTDVVASEIDRPDSTLPDLLTRLRIAASTLRDEDLSEAFYLRYLWPRYQLFIAQLLAKHGDPDIAFEIVRSLEWFPDDFDSKLIVSCVRHMPVVLVERLIAETSGIRDKDLRAFFVSPYLQCLPREKVDELVQHLAGELRQAGGGTGLGLAALIPFHNESERPVIRDEVLRLVGGIEKLCTSSRFGMLAPWLDLDQDTRILQHLQDLNSLKRWTLEQQVEDGLELVAAKWPQWDALSEIIHAAQHLDKPQRAEVFARAIHKFDDPEARQSLIRQARAAAYALHEDGLRGMALLQVALEVAEEDRHEFLLDALQAGLLDTFRSTGRSFLKAVAILLALHSPSVAYKTWQTILRHVARGYRPEVVADLASMRLVPHCLGGARQMMEIASALEDVGRWWP